MFDHRHSPLTSRTAPSPAAKALACVLLSIAVTWGTVEAREKLWGGSTASPTAGTAASSTAPATEAATTAPAVVSPTTRLQRTNKALLDVKVMQQKARDLASGVTAGVTAPNNLVDSKNRALDVPLNSWNKINGLKLATGVPKDLLKPTASDNVTLWTGAKLPTEVTKTSTDGTSLQTVTILQTQQQAVLNWQSFNIGKDTSLVFDQSAGGTNVSQWIAFNKIGVTGSPSQILGSIKTIGLPDAAGKAQAGGQVYVINPNGIIFGGSSQVNAHALVASSLPINDNLISRGLLNNPDSQFLFSALSLPAGSKGPTDAFTPSMTDEFATPVDGAHRLNLKSTSGISPVVSYVVAGAEPIVLKAGADYAVSTAEVDGKTTVTLTAAGLKQAAGATMRVAYTPAGDQYGNVVVQAGALLTAPTNADHVGGRVALVGPNVSNAGTISTADGQAILAAGLQVGFAPHNSADATLRGLDAFVGAVALPVVLPSTDSTTTTPPVPGVIAGTVTNSRIVNADQSIYTGLIEAPRGAVTLTGRNVNQNGFIESSTSLAYNGRVDLVAGYNAVSNPTYDPNSTDNSLIYKLPFYYQSNVGDVPTNEAVANSGRVNLGLSSVLRILPEASKERAPGDLALPSQVNIQGQSIHFDTDSTVFAPGAAVPLAPAYGFDGRALDAGVTVRAGAWFKSASSIYDFVQANDDEQIYVNQGAAIDVAGSADVAAEVSENIVSVELRGSELANSPLQRDGPLRGQTIQVDIRQHGPWDPNLNWDEKTQTFLGGYTWVGTPLADTSGWVGLATHSVEELTVNGGSVSLKAGGAVVLQTGSTVDVSGGSIHYKAGETRTTKVSADGHIYDISQALADRKYDGVYSATTTKTDAKWGTTETTTSPLAQSTYEAAYTQGGSAGSLAISAPVLALDGTMRGNTVAGGGQRTLSPLYDSSNPPNPSKPVVTGAPGWLVGALSRPLAGQFSLNVGRQYLASNGGYQSYSPTPANIVITAAPRLAPADDFISLGDGLAPAVYPFYALRKNELDLSASLFDGVTGSGFGIVKINNGDDALGAKPGEFGNVTVKAGTALTFAPGGSLTLGAGNITVEKDASITVSGGSIIFNAYDISSSVATLAALKRDSSTGLPVDEVPVYNNKRGNVVISTGAKLSVAGGVIDDRRTAESSGQNPLVTKGGKIELKASNLTLQSTSALDVSGGAAISATGKFSFGDAGSITLQSGKDLNFDTVVKAALVGGRLDFNGAVLNGYAGVGKKGGGLTIQAPSVLISHKSATGTTVATDLTGKLSLDPEFFSTGGFESFTVTGLGVAVGTVSTTTTTPAVASTTDGKMTGSAAAFTVAASTVSLDKVVTNTVIQPRVKNWESLPGGNIFQRPVGLSNAVSLDFKTGALLRDVTGELIANNVNFLMGLGSVITVEPGGKVAMSGGTVDVLGRVTAKGGSIAVAQSSGTTFYTPAVHFGSASALDASGAAVYQLDANGNRYKSDVLDGGTITITGNIVAEKGANFNVSGVRGDTTVDGSDPVLAPPGKYPAGILTDATAALVPVVKESNGGTLTLSAKELLFTAATLQGAAGGSSARGGTLVVESRVAQSDFLLSRTDPDTGLVETKANPEDSVMTLSATTPNFFYQGLGKAVTDKSDKTATVLGDAQGLGLVQFGADSFATGGFGGLSLIMGSGALKVQGNVSLTASRQITVADGGVLTFSPDPKVPTTKPSLTLTAPVVTLGRPFLQPQATTAQDKPFGATSVSSTHDTGTLTVQASTLIDVGTLALQNATAASLDATYDGVSGTTSGAIRGSGTLDVAGDIVLKAGQIYPPTALRFDVIANDYTTTTTTTVAGLASTTSVVVPGSVTIQSSGLATLPALPLSAGGKLNIFASTINQGGVLRAPLGAINLGATASSGVDPLSGQALPVTAKLTLLPGSVTSVSAVDPTTGKATAIPYGINVNGDTWVDPTGTAITGNEFLTKAITLSGGTVDVQGATISRPAARVDLAGGGDLTAYQFIAGAGGKTDILLGATAASFAIVPGYTDAFAPQAAYSNSSDAKTNLGSDTGYVIGNVKLNYKAGDRIHLEAGSGLPAGDYTLLPARYALLPGAYLVTPQTATATGSAIASLIKADGSTLVSGYQFNGFDASGRIQPFFRIYEVAAQAVVAKRAEYKQYSADAYFTALATSNEEVAPRLPVDAGRLSLIAGSALRLQGAVSAQGATGGRGGLIDISSSSDILIGSPTVIAAAESTGLKNTLLLDAKQLSGFGAESLLIGGVRSSGEDGTLVTVATNNITVNNAGSALTGSDIILASNETVTLKDGAEVGKAGQVLVPADPLTIIGSTSLKAIGDTLDLARGGTAITLPGGTGNGKLTATSSGFVTTAAGVTTKFLATTSTTGVTNAFSVPVGATITLDQAGKIAFVSTTDKVPKSISLALGDGALLRLSSDSAASVVRQGVAGSTKPAISLGAGVKLAGAAAIIDSTNATNLDAKVDLSGVKALSLDSGRVSVLLDQPGTVTTTGSLVLSREAQLSLLKSASAISLLSYSTIDLYGTGTFGASTLDSIGLHAGTIRGFPNSTSSTAGVTIAAKSITLDNRANAAATAVAVATTTSTTGTTATTMTTTPSTSTATLTSTTAAGNLAFNAGTLHLGGNQLEIQNFGTVAINATGGILAGDSAKLAVKSGGLSVVGGDLSITTPLITSASATDQSIATDGKLALISSAGTATVSSGLGAKLALSGDSVAVGTAVKLSSGTLVVAATDGDLTVKGGTLDVSGTAQQFYEVTKYTDAGSIALSADGGDLLIAAGSKVSVAANAGGGAAGALMVSVPTGSFDIAADTVTGKAVAGAGGSFSLDTLGIPGTDKTTSNLATLSQALFDGGFTQAVALRVRKGNVVADGKLRAHDISIAADQGSISVTGTLDASGLIGATRADPFKGVMNPIDPTGGKIELTASGNVVLAPSAWLTAEGYAYSNAGKGGSIALSAGSFTGLVDTLATVDIQSGARLDLGVLNRFTPNDLLLRSDNTILPVSTRTDLFTGTLHLRESQTAFGSGAQFSTLADAVGGAVRGASGVVLEGYQVFDLAKTDGVVSPTANSGITSIGSGGLVDSTVEQAVKDNGAAFIGAVSSSLFANTLYHVQPGAEIVNTGAATNTFVTLTASGATTGSSITVNVPKASNSSTPGSTTLLVPGGIFLGDTIKLSASATNVTFTVNFTDGSNTVVTGSYTASAANSKLVKSITFKNNSTTLTRTATLAFSAGSVPIAVVVPSGGQSVTGTPTGSNFVLAGTVKPTLLTTTAGDLTLAGTWDLSTFRFGTKKEPGNLTLRAKGNLVFGYDASLSDGFDATNAIDAGYPLWMAALMTDRSWSYRLVGGADYSAANSKSVQSLRKLGAATGSVLVGQGSPALPTATGSAVTRAALVPRYFQTIRTGTGDIEVAAGRDVQLLNPLATIYTAGRRADPLEGFDSKMGFDVPVLDSATDKNSALSSYYSAQYSLAGGDVTIRAQNDIARYVLSGTNSNPGTDLVSSSSKEMPTNWLYRRGNVGEDGNFVAYAPTTDDPIPPSTEVQSTSWWIDFSNFFADTGALGGGNVSLLAGRDVSNINAAAPTNARMPGKNADGEVVGPNATKLVEFGGGDVTVRAGTDISGGVFYVERGTASLHAGGDVKTDATRNAFNDASLNPVRWLPATFFLGKGRINVAASGDIALGAMANPFWQPQGAGNRLYETSYFSTFDPKDEVNIASLGGTITLQGRPASSTQTSVGTGASLAAWYNNAMFSSTATAKAQPWLLLGPAGSGGGTAAALFQTVTSVLPATVRATAFAGDIDLVGRLTLAPSTTGTLDLLAAGNINGVRGNGLNGANLSLASATINLSDADPARLPSISAPISNLVYSKDTAKTVLAQVEALFADSGRTNLSLAEKSALHGQTTDAADKTKPVPLHYNDRDPLRLYALGGDLSGVTLTSAKSARVIASNDIADVSLYVQNVRPTDTTVVAAGHDISLTSPTAYTLGDVQIAGPGTLEVLAGRNLTLGSRITSNQDGRAVGITSVGSVNNPALPQSAGASIVAAAGVGSIYTPAAVALRQAPGLATTPLDYSSFVAQFLEPSTSGEEIDAPFAIGTPNGAKFIDPKTGVDRYLTALGSLMGLTSKDPVVIWTAFGYDVTKPLSERQATLVLQVFQLALRDAARDRNDPTNPNVGTYKNGFTAIKRLFRGSPLPTKADLDSTDIVNRPTSGPWAGKLSMSTRLIKTSEGGDITLLVPGGDLTVGRATDPQKPDQGVLTERGGGISIFSADSVNVGTSRIFTLRGGNEILWSTWGNIAAGSGSKTVFSAPPTRVLLDPQSGDVQNDLAGLATGAGIGVLATLSGVKPGDVDLIAPVGTIDAGDAGIRSSGNLNIAARVVLNAGNIQVGGSSAGTPPPPPAPNLGSLTAATTTSAGASSAATDVAKQSSAGNTVTELPSMISVEVLGYGGGEGDDEDEEKKKNTTAALQQPQPNA